MKLRALLSWLALTSLAVCAAHPFMFARPRFGRDLATLEVEIGFQDSGLSSQNAGKLNDIAQLGCAALGFSAATVVSTPSPSRLLASCASPTERVGSAADASAAPVLYSAEMFPDGNASTLVTGLESFINIPASRIAVVSVAGIVNAKGEPVSEVNFYFTPANTSATGGAAAPRSVLELVLESVDGAFLTSDFRVARLLNNATRGFRPEGGWRVRVVGGPRNSVGRLEVKPVSPSMPNAAWGTVSSRDFDADAALAACHSAGFRSATVAVALRRLPPALAVTASTPVYMTRVDCDVYPPPTDLGNCTYHFNETTGATYAHDDDVGVNCDPGPFEVVIGGYAPGIGAVYVRNASAPNAMLQNLCLPGSITANGTTANHLCSELGFNATSARFLPDFGVDLPQMSTLWECSAVDGTGHVAQCTQQEASRFGCRTSTAVGIDCRNDARESLAQQQWSFTLGDPPGPTASRGVLFAQDVTDSEHLWGTVCSANFDNNDALHMCRALGFDNVSFALAMPNLRPKSVAHYRSRALLDDVVCGTNASAGRADCTGVGVPSGSQWRPCQPFEAVGVDCTGDPPSTNAPVIGYVAYVNNASQSRSLFEETLAAYLGIPVSRVDVYSHKKHAMEIEGVPVSRANFSFRDAPVADWYKVPSRAALDYEMQRMSTSGAAIAIGIVGLYANTSGLRPTDTGMFQARVVANGPHLLSLVPSVRGLLQVRPNSSVPWGTVCSLPSFSTIDATAACRAAFADVSHGNVVGLFDMNIPRGSPLANRESEPVWMSGAACDQSILQQDGNLFSCPFTFSPNPATPLHDCGHADDVFVECYFTLPPTLEWGLLAPPNISGGAAQNSREGAGLLVSNPAQRGGPASTVCNHQVSTAALLAACHSLGFTDAVAPVIDNAATFSLRWFADQFTIGTADLTCPSGPNVTLANCSYTYPTDSCRGGGFDALWIKCYPDGIPTSSFQYRLAEADAQGLTGRLEVQPHPGAPWGTVCDDNFGTVDANVACRSLGKPPVSQGARSSSFRLNTLTTPVYMDDVTCTANASTLADCDFVYSTPSMPRADCTHFEDIYLDCRQPNATNPRDWQVRIVPMDAQSNPDAGRVEIMPSPQQPWGTICGNGASGADVALRVCRTLGYNVSFGMIIYDYGTKSPPPAGTPTYLANLNCSGDPGDRIQNCTRFTYSVPGNSWNTELRCSEYNAIGVDCSGVVPQDDAPVLRWSTNVNGSVSEVAFKSRFTNALGIAPSRIVVTSLVNETQNGTTSVSWRFDDPPPSNVYNEYGRGDLDFLLRAESFANLQVWLGFNFLFSNSSRNMRPSGLEFRLVPDGSTDPSRAIGRLEARPSPTAPWGTVCSNGWGPEESLAACHSAGYAPDRGVLVTVAPGNGTVYVSDVDCSSTDHFLQNCSYTFSTATDSNAPAACRSHNLDVGLNCEGTREPVWQFQLTRNVTNRIGGVQVRPFSDSAWGTICGGTLGIFGKAFNDRDALSVCRSLGFTDVTLASAVVNTGHITDPLTGPIYIGNVDCTGTDYLLQNCSFTYYDNVKHFPMCSHYQDVTVDCTRTDPSSWDLWLDSNTTVVVPGQAHSNRTGLLRFRPSRDAPWGGVCSSGFDDTAALAVCHSLGFTDITAAMAISDFGAPSGFPYLSGVTCGVNDTTLDQCDYLFTTQSSLLPRCTASQFVGLDCRGIARPPLPIIVFNGTIPSATASSFTTVLAVAVRIEPKQVDVLWMSPELPGNVKNTSWKYLPPHQSDAVATTLGTNIPTLTGIMHLTSNVSAEVRHTMRFRLTPLGPYLPGPEPPSAGRVEVQPFPGAAWGTMCDDGFNEAAAHALCASLGFPPDQVAFSSIGRVSTNEDIVIDDSNCANAPGPYYQNCSFLYSDPAWDKPIHDCNHIEDVVLNCKASPSGADYEYRLDPRTTESPAGTGWLEARPKGSLGAWAPFCAGLLLEMSVNAACASAGYTTDNGAIIASPWSGSGLYQYTVNCPTTATSLANCSVNSAPFCTGGRRRALLDCRSRDTSRFVVNVVPNSDGGPPERGTLTIRSRTNVTQLPNSTFCTRGFDDFDATLACRSAGFKVSEAMALPYWGAPAGLVPRVARVDCDPSDETLDSCALYGTPQQPCQDYAAVGVDCTGTARPTAVILEFTLAVPDDTATIPSEQRGSFAQGLAYMLYLNQTRVLIQRNISDANHPGFRLISFTFGEPILDAAPTYGNTIARGYVQADLLAIGPGTIRNFVGGSMNLTSNSSNAILATMEFKLVPAFGRPSVGLLKTRPDRNSGWGTVCNDGFDNVAAAAVCRSLGFPGAASAKVVSLSILGKPSGAPGPIYIDDTRCPPTAQYFQNCTFFFSDYDYQTNDCTHNEDIAVDCAPEAAGNWSFRLNTTAYDFGDGRIGTLQAQSSYGVWGRTCGDISDAAATYICSTLGYATTTARTFLAYNFIGFDAPDLPYTLSSGTCTSPTNCTFDDRDTTRCGPTYSALGIDCRDLSQMQVAVATANPKIPHRGLVTVKFSPASPNGTICSSGFADDAALAVCRSAGYQVSQAYALPYWGGGSGPILMSGVQCAPDEQLFQCQFSTRPPYCTHNEDAAVDCSGQPRPPPPVLLWTVTSAGRANGDELVSVLSRWLRIPLTAFVVQSTNATAATWVFQNTSDTNFVESRQYYDSRVSNLDPATAANLGVSRLYANNTAIVKREMQVKLAPSPQGANVGVVLVKPTPDEDWGAICASSMTIDEQNAAAAAVCRGLGYPSGGRYFAAAQGIGGAIYLHRLRCGPNAANLSQCEFIYSTVENPLHWCSHVSDLAVECNATAPADTWQFQLQPINATTLGTSIGRLAARRSTSASFEPVCGPIVDDNVAKAVCRSLQYPAGRGRIALGRAPSTTPATWSATSFQCTGPNLADCVISSTAQRAAQCSRYDTVTVDCRDLTQMQARISGGGTRGLAQVRFDATQPWGTVCSEGFDDNAARTTCALAGHSPTRGFALNWWGGGTGPIYLSSVLCGPDDTSLPQCSFISGPPTGCEHWEDAAIDCSGNGRPPMPIIAFVASLPSADIQGTFAQLGRVLMFDASRVQILGQTPDSDDPSRTMVRWVFTEAAGANGRDRSAVENSVLGLDRDERRAFQLQQFSSNISAAIEFTMRMSLNGPVVDSNRARGVLLVRPSSFDGFGTVCAAERNFGTAEASAACRSMGYRSGVVIDAAPFARAAGPIYLSNVICQPGDATLQQCTFTYSTPDTPRYNSVCTHQNDVAVECRRDDGGPETAVFKATVTGDASAFSPRAFRAQLAADLRIPEANVTVTLMDATGLSVVIVGAAAIERANNLSGDEAEKLHINGLSPEDNGTPAPAPSHTGKDGVFLAIVGAAVAVIGAGAFAVVVRKRRATRRSAQLDEVQAAINEAPIDSARDNMDYVAMEDTAV